MPLGVEDLAGAISAVVILEVSAAAISAVVISAVSAAAISEVLAAAISGDSATLAASVISRGFRGGHFGGMHFGHFGRHFGGANFGGRHFTGRHFTGRHFGGGHFGGGHFGGRYFARGHFGDSHFRHANLAGHRFGGAGGLGGRGAFAHNAFSGRGLARFSGVRNFDPHGFNRNAFGSMAGWNAWGNNYWGAGWNDWGTGWGYWAGPIFWPFFYGDVLTFALWPYAFYDPFFASGADLLLTSIFWPGPLFSPYYAYNPYYTYYPYYGEGSLFNIYGYAPHANGYVSYGYYGDRPHHYRHHRLYASRSAAHANLGAESSAPTCGGLAPGVVSLPIDLIERAIRPTDAQTAILNDLKAASTQADNILRASCPTEISLTPVARLDAVVKRIQAMSEAVQILRAPLATLYNSLNDDQKDRFAAIGTETKYRRARIAGEESPASDLGGLCKQQTGSFTQVPVQRIEEAIKPTEQQEAAFNALKSTSAKAAANLDASCPSEIPEDIAGPPRCGGQTPRCPCRRSQYRETGADQFLQFFDRRAEGALQCDRPCFTFGYAVRGNEFRRLERRMLR